MIRVRPRGGADVEEVDLAELERRIRAGNIGPHDEICFPVLTGDLFVAAHTLELFHGVSAADDSTFRRTFHLGRVPWLTLTLIAALAAVYFFWQGGRPASLSELGRLGAKSPALMIELGQWWRLLTSNLLHASGWHLAANALFLLNLGGPAEAIFRRLDYGLLLLASALGTGALSLAGADTSCGASGIVFGAWGATALFGLRFRKLLPTRYRRYFFGIVIPYAALSLYLGVSTPGVDNWGHLGGLVAGSAASCFFPPRMLAPHDARLRPKLLLLAAVPILLFASSFAKAPVRLSTERCTPRFGLRVPVPERWREVVARQEDGIESYAFENRAGVSIGFETRREEQPVQEEELGHRFIDEELRTELEEAGVQAVEVSAPQPTTLAGLPAHRVHAVIITPQLTADATYWIAGRGYLHHVVSFTAPRWLVPSYEELASRVVAGVSLQDPPELSREPSDP